MYAWVLSEKYSVSSAVSGGTPVRVMVTLFSVNVFSSREEEGFGVVPALVGG